MLKRLDGEISTANQFASIDVPDAGSLSLPALVLGVSAINREFPFT